MIREIQTAIVITLIFVMALGGIVQAKGENKNLQNLPEKREVEKLDIKKLPEEIKRFLTEKESTTDKTKLKYDRILEEHLLEKKRQEEEAKRKAEEEKKRQEEEAKRKQVVVTTGYTPNFNEIYMQASQRYGVAWQIIAAIHVVETGQRGNTVVTSYAGASGPMQFMPATWAAYGQDGNGDGVANIHDVHDAIFGAANYLKANGGGVASIYRYNHSNVYVNHVLSIARGFGYQG